MAEEFGRVLVLGGIRSGKSEYAETLLARAPQVTLLTTGPAVREEAWAAQTASPKAHRPENWLVHDVGTDLMGALTAETALLVDDLGSWLSQSFDSLHWREIPDMTELVSAVTSRTGPLVLVSPEAGMSTSPVTEPGRMFADTLGELNRRLAEVCDSVVLVVAGAPIWLKGAPPSRAALSRKHRPAPIRTHATPGVIVTGLDLTELPNPFDPAEVVRPDEKWGELATQRLDSLDVHGRGLGALSSHVIASAGHQELANPHPHSDIRLLLLNAVADSRPALGMGVYPLVADRAGIRLEIVELSASDTDPVLADLLTVEEVEAAIDRGRTAANKAVDSGADMLILGTLTNNTSACAALTSLVIGAEPAEILAPVVTQHGKVDDNEWMKRCGNVRDALVRVKARSRDPKTLLAMLGGTELAVATGIVLGASERRTPIVIDGPFGMTAALLTRELAGASRHWLRLWDEGTDPLVRLGGDVLDLVPVFDLKLDLGEGANAAMTLPLMQTALMISSTLTSELETSGESEA